MLRGLLPALLVVRLVDETVAYLPAGALESIRDDLDLTYGRAALLLVLFPAGGVLGVVPTVAADYVSRRFLAVAGAAGYGVGLLVFAAGAPFAVLAVTVFLMGAMGDAMVHGAEIALVDEARPRLQVALARVNALAAVGDLLGPLLLAGVVAAGFGWQAAFGVAGAMALLYGAWLGAHRFPPPRPPEHRPLAGVVAAVRDRRVLALGLAGGLLSLLDEPFLAFVVAFLQQERGQDASVANLVAGASVAGGLVAYLVLGRPGRVDSLRPGGVAAAVLPLGVVGLVLAPSIVLQGAAGFGVGASIATIWLVVQHARLTVREGQAGTTTAVASSVEMATVAFPLAAGAVADAHGLAVTLWLYAAVAVAVGVVIRGTTRAPGRAAPRTPAGGDPSPPGRG